MQPGWRLSPPVPKVVLIVPVGRARTLRLLLPHLLAARAHYDYCELWMNACWDVDDITYIRDQVRKHAGTFVLKDDGGSEPDKQQFKHYGRYYKTLGADDTIYVKLDDDVIWMSPDAIQKLVEERRRLTHPLIIVGNTVNNAFCNFQHQRKGVYSPEWTLEGFRAKHNYDGEFAEFAHQTLMRHIRKDSTYVYQFESCARAHERIPNHVYAFFGRDISWSLDDEAHIGEGLSDTDRPVWIQGDGGLFAHFAYGEQWGYMDSTETLREYRALAKEKGYAR